MAAGAALMGAGASVRHIQIGQIDLRVVVGLALGGIPAVLVAAFIVKSDAVGASSLAGHRRRALCGGGHGPCRLEGPPRTQGRSGDRGGDRSMTDVDALNREFEKYDQVRKAHTYRLAEGERDEFDDDYRIATLDFGQFLRGNAEDKARFAEAFAGALEEIGFAVLTGHGVDPALYDEMHDATLDLFTSTPLEQKMRFRAERFGSVSQGYFPIEETSDIHPDLVEGWVWCRRAFDIPDRNAGAVSSRRLLARR